MMDEQDIRVVTNLGNFVRHAVPIAVVCVGLFFFWLRVRIEPQLTTGAFIHRDDLPQGSVCEEWTPDPMHDREIRRCISTSFFYTTTIIQHRQERGSDPMHVSCEEFSFELHRWTVQSLLLAGLLTWAGAYYAWSRAVSWVVNKLTAGASAKSLGDSH